MTKNAVIAHPMNDQHWLIEGDLVLTADEAKSRLVTLADTLRAHIARERVRVSEERLPLPVAVELARYTHDGMRAIVAYTPGTMGDEGFQTRVDALVEAAKGL